MSADEAIVFAVVAGALALFAAGRWRYDLVGLLALLALTLTGVVPAGEAFRGFGHPAVITVASVLIISRALQDTGVIDTLAGPLARLGAGPMLNIAALTGTVALLSGFMNNVGAMALVMPVAVRTARENGFSPGMILMPLAFGSLLGGMTTMIGTPPNVIVAGFRDAETGEPFRMFDFAPAGAAAAIAGVAFISLAGWRLVPRRRPRRAEQLFAIDEAVARMRVPPGSRAVGMSVGELETSVEPPAVVAALVREGAQILVPGTSETIAAGDALVLAADSRQARELAASPGLEPAPFPPGRAGAGLGLVEAAVPAGSALAGAWVHELNLRRTFRVNLLGVSRGGRPAPGSLTTVRLVPGDVLLLQGRAEDMPPVLRAVLRTPSAWPAPPGQRRWRGALAATIFAAAILATASGLLDVQVSFAAAALLMVLAGVIGAADACEAVDWPIVVLLGSMLTVGAAFESSGAAGRMVDGITFAGGDLPAAALLVFVLAATMLLANALNTAAAAVLMAPIAIQLAASTGASIDPFLMAVAIGASCAFLTPTGHQSNLLVLAPGGYHFGDYWRLGLPLQAVVVVAALPVLLLVWPP
jgi:di/tricarboxylate transporter